MRREGRAISAPPRPGGVLRYCGRDFTPAELDTIRALTNSLPTRAQIAEATCAALDWRRPDGATKAMSARVACLRMAADGLITLPPPRNTNGNGRAPRHRHGGRPVRPRAWRVPDARRHRAHPHPRRRRRTGDHTMTVCREHGKGKPM